MKKNQLIERIVGNRIGCELVGAKTASFCFYFEAPKARDYGLHRRPTITLSIIKLILNSFIRRCTFLSNPKKRSEASPVLSSTHSFTMVQRILSFYFITILFIFLHTKSREVSRLFRMIICLLISRGFLLNNLPQLVQLVQLLQQVCYLLLIQQLYSSL